MASEGAVRLSERVWRIPTMRFGLINSFALVEDDGGVTLVDCGLKRAPARIVRGLAAIGKQPGDVRRIVLTHAHTDHAGGLAALAASAGDPSVEVHADDAGYVRDGVSAPPDLSLTIGRLMARGPDQRFAAAEVGRELHDGDVLPVAGGLRVVHTPGHTPGHVSLLHEPDGVLITGDSLVNVLGIRRVPGSSCTNAAQARSTARRLIDLEYSVVAFTHGPEIRSGARAAIGRYLQGR
jgi:glyoxylase-like metal-dependent hydrolase (beta-lactamase superfamily II)